MSDGEKQVEEEISTCPYWSSLPAQIGNFSLQLLEGKVADRIPIFSYTNGAMHRRVLAYYHEETMEYKLQLSIGLLDFCVIEFIKEKLADFTSVLQERLFSLLDGLEHFQPAQISVILRHKGILEWQYEELLPPTMFGFQLFITPHTPQRIINGSYIIFDYSDFASHSNFVIYYNVYRDEFFAEKRFHDIPEISYLFDASDLATLTEKITAYLPIELQKLRARIEAEA